MLLQPCTRSSTSGEKKALGECDLGPNGVEEVEGDGVPPQKHQLVLFTFRGDEDVVSKGPGDTTNRHHGFGPGDQHESNEGHGQGAPLGDAHGVSMGLPEQACY